MDQGRGFASLSAGLLARKGTARPAMRPQGFQPEPTATPTDDLGWDDMGEATALPLVARQQAAIAQAFASPAEAVPTKGKKAAFTLRLDAARHLRLRMACAIEHRSAQQIVTQALDAWLARMPTSPIDPEGEPQS